MRVGWAFLQTLTSQAVQSLASVLTGVLIARALGPTGQGQYAVFAAAIGLGVVAAGVGQFERNVIASAGQQDAGRLLLVRSIIQCLLIGLSLGATVTVWDRVILPAVRWVAPFFACVLALEVLAALIRGINLGQHHILSYNLITLLQRFAYLAGVGVLTFADVAHLRGVVIAWAVAVGTSMVVAIVWIWSRSRPASIRPRNILEGWGQSYVGGSRAWVTVVLSVLLVRCDAWMLGPMLNVAAVGQVSVASALAEYLWYIPSILANVLFARVAADPGPLAVRSICRASRAMVALLVPIVFLVAVGGPRLVPLIYGAPFATAGYVLVLLLPGMTALALYLVVDSYFAGIGFPPISIYAVAIALITKVGLNLLAVPSFGVLGAAGMTSVAYTTLFLIKLIAFKRRTGIAFSDVLYPRLEDLRENLALARGWVARRSVSPS